MLDLLLLMKAGLTKETLQDLDCLQGVVSRVRMMGMFLSSARATINWLGRWFPVRNRHLVDVSNAAS